MKLASNNPEFENYDGMFVSMLVNGVYRKFQVKKATKFTSLSGGIGLLDDTHVFTYSILGESALQYCETCIKEGVTIRVIYSQDNDYDGLGAPCSGQHQCDAAQFYFKANGIDLGLVDLNNLTDGGDRETAFTLTKNQALQIEANSVSGNNIDFQLICATPPDEDRGWGLGGCHTTVPWVYITNEDGDLMYSGCPETNNFTINLCDPQANE